MSCLIHVRYIITIITQNEMTIHIVIPGTIGIFLKRYNKIYNYTFLHSIFMKYCEMGL